MSKMNNRYLSETDDFVNTIKKNANENNKGKLPTVFTYTNSPLATTITTLSGLDMFPQKKYFL